MPIRLRLAAILAASLVMQVDPQHSVLAGEDAFADFDVYAQAALRDWKTPGMAVSVVKDGHLVFARGYGIRKVGGNDRVDVDTIFPIASVTKQFTATALAMLCEEGKVDWMDPVVKHLSDFQLHDAEMTRELRIADLLSHRSGLEDPDTILSSGAFTRKDLMQRAKFLRQAAPFRIGNHYNNLGPIVAGEILERISGRSWSEFVRTRIFQPLEMHSTVPDVVELKDAQNVATAYVSVRGELREDQSWTLPLSAGWRQYRETIRPAGAICSTVNDLAKFLTFQLAGGEYRGLRLLKADTILEMQALHSVAPLKNPPDPNLAYSKFLYGSGLGWQIRDYRGRKLVMHGGSSGTVIALVPEENLGVAVLTNLGCGIQYMVLHDVIDRLLGIPRTWSNRDWIKDTIDNYQKAVDAGNDWLNQEHLKALPPELALSQYAGTYISDLGGRLVITKVDGNLSMQWGPNCRSELVPWSGNRFRARFVLRFPEDWLLSFVSKNGRAMSVTVRNTFPSRDIATFKRADR